MPSFRWFSEADSKRITAAPSSEPDSPERSRTIPMERVLTPDALRNLVASLLEGAAGKTHIHWLEVIGRVEYLTPLLMHIEGNWRVHPRGSSAELGRDRESRRAGPRRAPLCSGVTTGFALEPELV